MTESVLSTKIKNILRAQIGLMDSIYILQKDVYTFVLKRDWEKTKEGIAEVDTLSEKFKLADKNLVQLMNEHSNKKTATNKLDGLLNQLSYPEREKVNTLYKTLKEKIYLSKIENDVFNIYLQHAHSLLTGIFVAVSEDRCPKTYTRTGVKTDSDMSNVLVNRVF